MPSQYNQNRNPSLLHKRTAELTPSEVEVLNMAGTLTIEEISEKLSLSKSTVRGRLHSAREKKRDFENMKIAGVQYGRWG